MRHLNELDKQTDWTFEAWSEHSVRTPGDELIGGGTCIASCNGAPRLVINAASRWLHKRPKWGEARFYDGHGNRVVFTQSEVAK